MKNYWRVLGALIVLLALFHVSAAAQSGRTVEVPRRDADITLLENGDAQFVETWVVDFQNGAFTSAFREIPKNNLREIVDVKAYESNQPLELTTDETDARYKFTWRFPATNAGAKFFSDVHTFTLRYTVRGAARIYPQGDQFWWKFIEADRAYPIGASTVRLHLPGDFPTDQLKAATYIGANAAGGGTVLNGSTLEFRGGPFPPQAQWEIRAQFPHVLTAEPEEWQKQNDRAEAVVAQNNFYAVLATVFLIIGGPLVLLLLWYLLGRDKPIMFAAEFLPQPPDDTPPGIVGTLLDERADLQDILATVADLAQRGYLRIREGITPHAGEFERLPADESKLAPFEKETLDALFSAFQVRRLDDMRGFFYIHLQSLQNALYEQAVALGLFPASPLATRDFYFKVGRWGAVLVPLIGIPLYCITSVFGNLLFLPLIVLEILFLCLIALSRVMPQRSPQGAAAAAKWNAFRRYLVNIEKYTKVVDAGQQFAAYLPYAIAFGLEKSWIDKFQATAVPAPMWYIPFGTGAPAKSREDGEAEWGAPTSFTPERSVFSSQDTLSANPFGPTSTASTSETEQPRQGNAERNAPDRLPDLNTLARGSFVGLNSVSTGMFDFLDSSASAFTDKPAETSAADTLLAGIGTVVNRIGTSSGRSSSSNDSWSSSSSSPSDSSSSSWSGGGSSGGGGGGGGSSGFG